jgi:hypothetical protein
MPHLNKNLNIYKYNHNKELRNLFTFKKTTFVTKNIDLDLDKSRSTWDCINSVLGRNVEKRWGKLLKDGVLYFDKKLISDIF